jgi:glycosyltransferase involved in cell wall biosynthesis
MTEVCFASLAGFEGCVTSCRHSAAVLGGEWAAFGRDECPPAVLDADLLVLSSWHETYEPILSAREAPTVPRWHSSLLQSELSQETWKIGRLAELLDGGGVPAVAVNDDSFVVALRREAVVHLPDVLDLREYEDIRRRDMAGVNVSLFGVGHSRKNVFVQSAAFMLAREQARGSSWTLHLNGQADLDPAYLSWLEIARVPYVDHGWLERHDYLELLASMDAGLHVSLSESYCYGVADYLGLGVPVVTSPTVSCADAGPLVVGRPHDVYEVADRLTRALEQPELVRESRRSLVERAQTNAERARSALAELLERAGYPRSL